VLGTIAVHIVLIFALLQLGARFAERERVRLVAVDLSSPPSPAQSDVPPPPAAPQVTVVPPAIELPRSAPIQVVIPSEPLPQAEVQAPPPQAPAPPAPAPSIIDGANLEARMVSGRPPRYPIESRRNREQGTVVLSLTLGTDGKVAQISIARSSGFDRLDKAALEAVKRWRWAPTVRDGQPVMVRGVVEIPFVLQDRAA